MTTISIVPDTQVRPGDNLDYLDHIGSYLADKKPDVIIHLGDHWDMPSLSSYDKGKKAFEGRRYRNDVEYGNIAMRVLLQPIRDEQDRLKKNKEKQWKPQMHFLIGNHEQRIERAVNDNAQLEGVMGYKDLDLRSWNVHDFLKVVTVEGIAFSHYFVTGVAGRPAGSASAQLNKKHMSCVAGHQQGLQIATAHRADGKRITSVIAGSAYPAEHDYLGPQGNQHWRGILSLFNCNDGEFDLVPVPLTYLEQKYAG